MDLEPGGHRRGDGAACGGAGQAGWVLVDMALVSHFWG